MKKYFPAVLLSGVIVSIIFMHACTRGEEGPLCRTCRAKYQGETIATKEACSFAEENQFENEFSYATVTCE